MIKFQTKILKFAEQGEKTGWSYIKISKAWANKLNPGVKKSFRIKGQLDSHLIQKVAVLPVGEGNFILPFNTALRKATGKKSGDTILVAIELDERPLKISADFLRCLKDDPLAFDFFKTLPKSHQHYFSKWIDSAKTSHTKSKRITMSLLTFESRQSFNEMMKANKGKPVG